MCVWLWCSIVYQCVYGVLMYVCVYLCSFMAVLSWHFITFRCILCHFRPFLSIFLHFLSLLPPFSPLLPPFLTPNLPSFRSEVHKVVPVGGQAWRLGQKTFVMGVLNVTPDSFSDGGRFLATDAAVARAHEMIAEGCENVFWWFFWQEKSVLWQEKSVFGGFLVVFGSFWPFLPLFCHSSVSFLSLFCHFSVSLLSLFVSFSTLLC